MPLASTPPEQWNFVCPQDGAKFFDTEEIAECPRCGEKLTSQEKLVPPWKRLMNVKAVAERLDCSVSTVYGLIESGKLGHHRCPGVRVSEGQLLAYLDRTRKEAGPERERVPVKARGPRPRLRHVRLS